MITEAIATVVNGENLDKEMAAAVMDEIMSGEATQAPVSYTHLRAHETT